MKSNTSNMIQKQNTKKVSLADIKSRSASTPAASKVAELNALGGVRG